MKKPISAGLPQTIELQPRTRVRPSLVAVSTPANDGKTPKWAMVTQKARNIRRASRTGKRPCVLSLCAPGSPIIESLEYPSGRAAGNALSNRTLQYGPCEKLVQVLEIDRNTSYLLRPATRNCTAPDSLARLFCF